ncbi:MULTISPECIES: 3-methyl-2-oxobutanoate hydroxymethyltransferase [unclassified Guyparkeria]|uniref:3-methyl-2-oxobutanoate hydroxymethyltransferase n=1 Tax=unclassified Guyparkeria TaxID=2626246 RepID=UPI000733495F|nr:MULTISPECIES: 3-methyl-2-oxobutanoate hydroxymethyltransferase [unclassified Guyparkeria]KTG17569.1 3-methyl-2-oxobutanoate hydroxymethyltransferase [Guyparkeria sp. XI15]OAE88383.1 3-methyl-2-oxobutanoate hydroxymethyltransferase [Guyparkeria sp. WRN-7]
MTLARLHQAKADGQPIAMLTAYEAGLARTAAAAGVDAFLVGDSLGMVVQGQRDTLAVTVDEVAYHSAMVRRGAGDVPVVADMPFLSDATVERALDAAGVLMGEGGADMVKLEGGAEKAEIVRALTESGVPVCGHVGLLPQRVRKLGGYRVQGRGEEDARRILDDAQALVEAGIDLLVVECVPRALGRQLAEAVPVPVIGIGAGADTDGQVLVMHDMLGLTERAPRFVRNFMDGADSIRGAFAAYVEAVHSRRFPTEEESF